MKGTQKQQGQLITDSRFSFINFDPRFQKQKKKQTKVQIDQRFKSVLEDEKFQRGAKFDKFGRKAKVSKKNNELGELYYLEDEEQKEQKEIVESSEEEISEKFEWNEVSSSEQEASEPEDDNQPQLENVNNENVWEAIEESKIERKNIKSTKRLTMQNYDWTQINAKDIMMLMNSFKRQEGVVTKVTIYPSDYGLKQLALEEQYGPQGIWKDQKEHKQDAKKKNKIDDINEWIVKEGSKGEQEGIDGQKLREYEKQRMKYYYAVIEFESEVTAELVYEQLDGVEFEDSQMNIDLRFVPNELIFPNEPKEVCTQLPSDYKMNNFLNRALTHTFIKMTWDEPQLNRMQLTKTGDFKDELDENVVKQYLASDIEKISGEESSEQDDVKKDSNSESEEMVIEFDEDKKESNQNNDHNENNWRDDFNKKNRSNKDNVEMEITFNQGFEDLGNKIIDKQKQKTETAHDTYLRHQKERKQENKQKKRMSTTDDFFKDSKTTAKNKLNQKDLKQKQLAELELLIDKDDNEQFEPNVDDERFVAIYKANKYSIDPSKNKNVQESKFFKEQVKRRKQIKKN